MSRRLDATTAEIVKTLQRYGYDVSFPIEIDLQEYRAKVTLTLTGNRHALVSKNDQGGWIIEYAKTNPAAFDIIASKRAALETANAAARTGRTMPPPLPVAWE